MVEHYNTEEPFENETSFYREDCRESVWDNYCVFLNYLYLLKLYRTCIDQLERFENRINGYRDKETLLNLYEVAINSAKEIGDLHEENKYQQKRKKLIQAGYRFDDPIEPFFL